jgi:hypothetical protein
MIEASIRASKAEIRRSLITVAAVPKVQIALGAKSASCKRAANFEALPVTFDLTDAEFGERVLPWVRLACLWLRHDHTGVAALVRDMVRQGGQSRLDEAYQAWASCAELFDALQEFVESAKVRLTLARARIHREDAKHALRMSASERALPAGRRPALGCRKKKGNLRAAREPMRSRKCSNGSARASL